GDQSATGGTEAGRLRETARRAHAHATRSHPRRDRGAGEAAWSRLRPTAARHGRSFGATAYRCQSAPGTTAEHSGYARDGYRQRQAGWRGGLGGTETSGRRGAGREEIARFISFDYALNFKST